MLNLNVNPNTIGLHHNQIFLKFILDSLSHNRIEEEGEITNRINIKNRPYLDWFSILSKTYRDYINKYSLD